MHYNLVNDSYQQASKVLSTYVPNKQFGQLINISPHSLSMLSTTNTEFLSIELWFPDQNSKPLETEVNVNNMTLITGLAFLKWDIQQNHNTENTLKDTAFCHLQENLMTNMVKKIDGYCNKNRNRYCKNCF